MAGRLLALERPQKAFAVRGRRRNTQQETAEGVRSKRPQEASAARVRRRCPQPAAAEGRRRNRMQSEFAAGRIASFDVKVHEKLLRLGEDRRN